MTIFKTLMCWAAALTVGLCAATPASAQFEGEAEITALVAKSEPYQAMIVEAQDIFLGAIDHMNSALEKAEDPLAKAAAQEWSAAWEAKARARLAALKQRLATAPRITAEEAGKVLGPADKSGLGEMMADQPRRVGEMVEAVERTLNQTAALAPLAAAGDEVAMDKLSKELFAASLYMVEIENQLLRTAIAALRPGHPQRSLAQAILGNNLAMMEVQRVNLRAYNGEPLAAEAAAKRARAHVAEGMAAARRIAGEARAMQDALATSAPPEAKAFVEKTRKMFATFEESAKVEIESLSLIDEALSALAREDMEKVFADVDRIEALADRRIALQTERTGYLTQ